MIFRPINCNVVRVVLFVQERQDIPINRLLKFSNQIAEGMSYLVRNHIIFGVST